MAGPWFTVLKLGTWTKLGELWLSNGKRDDRGYIEAKIDLRNGTEEDFVLSGIEAAAQKKEQAK